jgi:hypothetical protein
MTTDLRYPIGKFERPASSSPDDRRRRIEEIAGLPAALRAAVEGLSPEQLDTPYRPGGWTVRQVVHHVPDSHINAYVRFRLALTEETPRIKPYDEARWAELPDARTLPPDVSLALLDALHDRWVTLLSAVGDDAWSRRIDHPENGPMTLDALLAMYAWHGRHHVAHVTALRERMGW